VRWWTGCVGCGDVAGWCRGRSAREWECSSLARPPGRRLSGRSATTCSCAVSLSVAHISECTNRDNVFYLF